MIAPGSPDYESARLLYNRMHDRRPAVIVRARDPLDVSTAVRFAADEGLPLSIRGGGHHIAGFGMCDGGIAIDFSTFRGALYNPERQVLIAEPGARLADIDAELCPLGRVLPSGTVSDTGLAGLALGGGIGWLTGRFGLTCDHLIDADVVLADGRIVRAVDDTELLWGLRGGGGAFGIVTRLRFRTRPLPPLSCGAMRVVGPAMPTALARLVRGLADECPRELTVAPRLYRTGGRPRLSVDFCIAGEPAAARAALARLRGLLPEARLVPVRGSDFPAWQRSADRSFMPPMRGYWKSHYVAALDAGPVESLVEAAHAAPGRGSILLEHLHGAFHDTDETTSAFPLRRAAFGVLFSNRWPRPEGDAAGIAWVRDSHAGLAAATGDRCVGSYLNYAPSDEPGVLPDAGLDLGWRLARLKARVDPANILRGNHNVHPLGDDGRERPSC